VYDYTIGDIKSVYQTHDLRSVSSDGNKADHLVLTSFLRICPLSMEDVKRMVDNGLPYPGSTIEPIEGRRRILVMVERKLRCENVPPNG
jgi:hypothetical protein